MVSCLLFSLSVQIDSRRFQPHQKWATMSRVTPWIKRAIWLLVIYGILYVLISPLPEMAAALSGRPPLLFVVPIICWLMESLLLLFFSRSHNREFWTWGRLNVLEMICLRLC